MGKSLYCNLKGIVDCIYVNRIRVSYGIVVSVFKCRVDVKNLREYYK